MNRDEANARLALYPSHRTITVMALDDTSDLLCAGCDDVIDPEMAILGRRLCERCAREDDIAERADDWRWGLL